MLTFTTQMGNNAEDKRYLTNKAEDWTEIIKPRSILPIIFMVSFQVFTLFL